MVAPFTALFKAKSTKLTSSEAAEKAFQNLKQAFTTAPILYHPDSECPFSVTLIHGDTKIVPRCLLAYNIGNRKLLTINLSLEEWRHWLEAATNPFIVFMDHKNLEYIHSTK